MYWIKYEFIFIRISGRLHHIRHTTVGSVYCTACIPECPVTACFTDLRLIIFSLRPSHCQGSFKVKHVLFVIFSHVMLQSIWFHRRHHRLLFIESECFVFKKKRPARENNVLLQRNSRFTDFCEFAINTTHCWTCNETFWLLWLLLFVALFSCISLLELLLTLSFLNPGSDASASAVCKED